MRTSPWAERWTVIRELAPRSPGGSYLVRPAAKKSAAAAASTSQFVLKTPGEALTQERRARMHHRVAALKTLDHSGVARHVDSNVEQFDRSDEPLYLVTEYVPGQDVKSIVGSRLAPSKSASWKPPLPFPEACGLVRRVLDTLAFCHGRDVVHRDIKPSNVVLREGEPDRPVLLDFGLSFTRDFPAAAPAPAPSEVAKGKARPSNGERFIVLPEDFSRGADRRNDVSDVTQCTGLLFYLLTGQHPGHLMDDRGRRPHEQERALRVLHKLGLPSPDPLFRLFDIGFAEDPDMRWQSARSLGEQIDRLLEPAPIAPNDHVTARARQIRKRLGDDPEISGQVTAEKHAGDIVNWISSTMNVLNEELGDVMTVGLVLSRPRPGFKKISMVFSDKLSQKHRLECSLSTVMENQQLLVLAECLGRTGEVVRIGLNDPEAPEVLRKAVETFLLDTADHFADGQV